MAPRARTGGRRSMRRGGLFKHREIEDTHGQSVVRAVLVARIKCEVEGVRV